MKNRIRAITSILIVMTILGGCSSKREDKIDEENLVERFSASGRQWRKN